MPRFSPRLRFSLRTLFVLVTVLCVCLGGLGYLGREWQLVRERTRMIKLLRDSETSDTIDGALLHIRLDNLKTSWLRRKLGDLPAGTISYILPPNKEQRDRIFAAFPEAEIGRSLGNYPDVKFYPADRNSLEDDAWFAEQFAKGAFVKYEQRRSKPTIVVGQHFRNFDRQSANRFLGPIYLAYVANNNHQVVQPVTIVANVGNGKTEQLGIYQPVDGLTQRAIIEP